MKLALNGEVFSQMDVFLWLARKQFLDSIHESLD